MFLCPISSALLSPYFISPPLSLHLTSAILSLYLISVTSQAVSTKDKKNAFPQSSCHINYANCNICFIRFISHMKFSQISEYESRFKHQHRFIYMAAYIIGGGVSNSHQRSDPPYLIRGVHNTAVRQTNGIQTERTQKIVILSFFFGGGGSSDVQGPSTSESAGALYTPVFVI